MFLYAGAPTVTTSPRLLMYIYAAGIVTIVAAVLSLLKEGYQFFQLRLNYITVYNLLELVLYGSALILAFTVVRGNECLCPLRIQYEFGAVAVFLAWINFVLFFRKLAYTGNALIYVVALISSVLYACACLTPLCICSVKS